MNLDAGITGIIMGGVLSLPVLGIAVIYGMTGITNFAIGTIGVFCAFMTWTFFSYGTVVGILVGLATSFVIGYVIQWFLLTPLSEKGGDSTLFFIVTICIGLVFTGLTRVLFPRPNISLLLPRMGTVRILGVTTSGLKIFAFFFALSVLFLIRLSEKHTNIGKSWRATSQNLKLAKTVGIDTQHVFAWASSIGCMLSFSGAVFWAALYNVSLMSGWDLTFLGFIIAVVGGIGNIWGGMLSALLMGMVMSYSGHILGGMWQSVVLYFIVILVLIISPRGILGSERSL
ncbi:MAG: branched-chain amino acid ABC transporter permease [Firmicutes bacterium]|jgi:branched-chain amino acid transport system permease protein|nr:branched-chain amino acid ABC transporter permease [Bacillota bacterium]